MNCFKAGRECGFFAKGTLLLLELNAKRILENGLECGQMGVCEVSHVLPGGALQRGKGVVAAVGV